MQSFNSGWYVVYTKPRHEKKVAEYLEGLQLQYFLPTTRILRIWPTKKKYVQMPLFPSYVFVRLDSLQHYFDSLQVPGVLYFVKIGNQIASIKEAIIHKLQAIISNNLDDIEVLSEHFNPGTTLNIYAGPFKGFCCEIIEHRGKNKILVRIELLQRNILVDLPSYCLEPNLV
jgi:transcriptional antiterminator RfaH